MSEIHDKSFPEFKALGAAEVRMRLACNQFHITQQQVARDWLLLEEANERKDTIRWARHAAFAAYAAAAIAVISIITTIFTS